MERNGFRLLMGGLEEKEESRLTFVAGHITDTRLMGVLYMYMRWVDEFDDDFHMFFYLDVEETGFEVYESLKTNDTGLVLDMESEMAGGLGGKMIDISEREAKALLQEYARFNREHGLPLPDGKLEYGRLLEPVELTEEEAEALMEKECVPIESEEQLIHYFLMRCFGHDYTMAEQMAARDVVTGIYDDYPKTSYYRNSIEKTKEGTYLCESLVESENQYYIFVSEIEVEDGRVTFFENCTKMAISPEEAAMILARSEYVNCYEILIGPDMFESMIRELAHNAMYTQHESGGLYMLFNENNDHVSGPVFQMNEDVFGVFYVTKYGQLIASSYEEKNINAMHENLRNHRIGRYLGVTGKYEFKEPVLYDFIQSGFDDFEEFIGYLHE